MKPLESKITCVLNLACVLLTASPSVIRASENPCDPDLKPPPNHPYGYRLRGERCEGIYARLVKSNSLRVVGFIDLLKSKKKERADQFHLTWPIKDVSENKIVNLRAQSLKPRTYYRMDAKPYMASGSFNWPSRVLDSIGLKESDVGITSWYKEKINGIGRIIYLPIVINNDDRNTIRAKKTKYRLMIVPGRELEEVYQSVILHGEEELALLEGEPLKYGYYPAGRVIKIDLPAINSQGYYEIEIGAKYQGDAVGTLNLWFYHSGNDKNPSN